MVGQSCPHDDQGKAPMKATAIAMCILFTALAAAPATQPVVKPAIVTTQQWGSTPQPIPESRKHTPKYITIHHAGVEWKGGDPQAFVKNMQSWGQRAKHWPDLPYHFLIAPNGKIFEGRPMIYEPESNTKYELQGNIGVEMMGHFEIQRPSQQQLESCVALVAWLTDELKISPDKIRGHNDAAPGQTTCPGKDFDRYLRSGEFKRWVESARTGMPPDIQSGEALPGGPTTRISSE